MSKRERISSSPGSQIHRLEQEHQALKTQVAALDRRRFLSDSEERLRTELKKQKLRAKDDIAELRRSL